MASIETSMKPKECIIPTKEPKNFRFDGPITSTPYAE